MNERVERLLDYTLAKKQAAFRRTIDWSKESVYPENASRLARAAGVLRAMLAKESENPVFIPEERIVLTRTVANLPARYTEAEMNQLRSEAYFHEMGVVFNLSPDYEYTLSVGLDKRREETAARRLKAYAQGDDSAVEFCDAVLSGIDAVLRLADSYRDAARKQGLGDIAVTLEQVPHKPARTFREALQFLRILHFSLWCEGDYHNGVGRFDQYMYPYLKADLDSGALTEESALDLLEEFFLTFNRDSDLYIGVQQGDNGQSMMLGGCDSSGADAVNLLTRLCLKASCALKVIDPKINLRVSSQTPFELLEAATELTKVGLGFPQYANDDVVIPGLVKMGYSLEDARNYSVAACWEFIIPGVGMDIPNIAAVSFPAVVDKILRETRPESFDDLMDEFCCALFDEADRIEGSLGKVDMLPCPLCSLLCDGRIEAGQDACEGNKYNNFGIHGTGFAPAMDSLAVVRKLVYDTKEYSLDDLVQAMDTNFAKNPTLLAKVRNDVPKMGDDDPYVDDIAVAALADFADSWEGRRNCRGGIYRTGTGSAMYYIWHANELPASVCGRLKGEPFPANYAPSLDVQIKGPISVIESFTKPDLVRNINGGPLTIEIHDSAFAHEDGLKKVASLIKLFVERGGHQLQINTINRETLLDAQKNPEAYKHLIVRVWGWSGYFIELDKPYQDQIIRRAEMLV